MRQLANTFLILFLLSAIVSGVDELGRQFVTTEWPRLPLQLIWFACYLSGLLVYLGFGFNRHLPKVILLPPLGWLIWTLLDYWPLEKILGDQYQLFGALAQLILGIILLNLNRLLNHQRFLVTAGQLPADSFHLSRLVWFSLLNLLVLPVLVVLIAFSLLSSAIDSGTDGFVKLKPDGLYLTERIYRRDQQRIHLAGMIHMGRPQYFQDLQDTIPAGKTLILLEGVSDRQGLLQENFSYTEIASFLGLSSQEKYLFDGQLIERLDPSRKVSASQLKPDLLQADIDLRELNPETIAVIRALARYVLNAESPLQGYLRFKEWAQQNATIDMNRIVMADLITKRNRHLLSYLPPALRQYDTLVIPWGALHLAGIEKRIQDMGFSLLRSRQRLSISFFELPYDRLWKMLNAIAHEVV